MKIHKTAIISSKANIAKDVEIGPNVIIEDGVTIAAGVKIMANAYICRGTEIGKNTEVHIGAVLGHVPQDVSFKKGTKSFLKIGQDNIIREYATIHRGSRPGSSTIIGDGNFIMGLSHIAHDCIIGNNIVLANGALVAGHAQIQDHAFISGNVTVHQFARIGELAMIAGLTRVNKDVPPFMLVKGDSLICSVNLVGIQRAGFTPAAIRAIKEAFKLLFMSEMIFSQALEKLAQNNPTKEVKQLIDFIKSSQRGICPSACRKGK